MKQERSEFVINTKSAIRAAFNDLRKNNIVLAKARHKLNNEEATSSLNEELTLSKNSDFSGAVFYTVEDNRNFMKTETLSLKVIAREGNDVENVIESVVERLNQRGVETKVENNEINITGLHEVEKLPRGRKPLTEEEKELRKQKRELEKKVLKEETQEPDENVNENKQTA